MSEPETEITYFDFGEKETEYLKKRDPLLGAAIDEIGHIRREVIPDMFKALVNSIVGQQISAKAQATVWKRIWEHFSPFVPETVAAATEKELCECGLSFRKASYIKEIAAAAADGRLDFVDLRTLPDVEVIKRLTSFRGIGVWTAEMLMIFSMRRPDIMSIDDLAILRGLRMLYRHRKITPRLFAKYKRRYSPYATVASLYLWAIAGGACEGLSDHAPMTEAQKKARAKKRRETGAALNHPLYEMIL